MRCSRAQKGCFNNNKDNSNKERRAEPTSYVQIKCKSDNQSLKCLQNTVLQIFYMGKIGKNAKNWGFLFHLTDCAKISWTLLPVDLCTCIARPDWLSFARFIYRRLIFWTPKVIRSYVDFSLHGFVGFQPEEVQLFEMRTTVIGQAFRHILSAWHVSIYGRFRSFVFKINN